MKVLITGATGFIGRPLTRALLAAGHSVVILSRAPHKVSHGIGIPVPAFYWDPLEGPPPEAAFEGVEAVIHLAGSGIADSRWSSARKKELFDSRVLGTRHLIKSLRKAHGPGKPALKVFLSASAIGYYGNRGGEILSETSLAGEGFLAQICQQWEAETFQVGEAALRKVLFRIGVVLGREGGALKKLIPLFRTGLAGPVGTGDQYVSWIHIDDLIALFLYSLSSDALAGPVNGVGPSPVTNKAFSQSLGKAMGKPAVFRAPAWLLKILYGEMATVVLASQRCSAQKAVEAGFKFRYPTIESALDDLFKPVTRHYNSGKIRSFRDYDELKAFQWVPLPVEALFPFFANETNLETLTPTWLNFRVLGKNSAEIEEGTLIDYRLRVHGMPVKWQSKIINWVPNESFIDTQTKGPYELWHHTHTFQKVAEGTLMTDQVRYRVLGGQLGQWLAGWFVRRDVTQIFNYRREKIEILFGVDLKPK